MRRSDAVSRLAMSAVPPSDDRPALASARARARTWSGLLAGVTLLVLLVLLVGAALAGPNEADVARWSVYVSVVSFAATVAALAFAARQYRRAEPWKRAEFVASAMKTFDDDRDARVVKKLVDYSRARVNLFHELTSERPVYEEITRSIQTGALLPHPIREDDPRFGRQEGAGADVGAAESDPVKGGAAQYSPTEVAIRDAYDAFLGHLERFGSWIETGLVTKEELEPYLRYWIDVIALMPERRHRTSVGTSEDRATWRLTLFTYVDVYGYSGVRRLFQEFGRCVVPRHEAYSAVAESAKRDYCDVLLPLVSGALRPDRSTCRLTGCAPGSPDRPSPRTAGVVAPNERRAASSAESVESRDGGVTTERPNDAAD